MSSINRLLIFDLIGWLFLLTLGCSTLELETPQEAIQSINQVSLPLVYNQYRLWPYQKMIVNEDGNWADVAQLYPQNLILKVTSYMPRDNPEAGIYDFSELRRETSGHQGKILLHFHGARPDVNDNRLPCQLPVSEHMDEYEAYLNATIQFVGPDRVYGIEIWNEPDVDPKIVGSLAPYLGCVGLTYDDGARYGAFASEVSSYIHNKYPEFVVWGGALLNAYHHADFVDGMLSTLEDVDGISFHAYTFCGDPDYWFYTPYYALAQKTDLNLFLSETSALYDIWSPECDIYQANYACHLNTINLPQLKAIAWYTGDEHFWRNCSLLNYDQTPKDAYFSFVKGCTP